ncbi:MULTISPECIES: autotransporter family protein [Pseudomonas]|uniref:Autotransporter outer membrane beta-barrel domain-containing protein n=1 Tax=Pseudomonas azadiae TaxID=2843612 RepID=A0ABS6P4Q0_9PSED|nr:MULTISPECIES: autotransporter outer membrane beta-barrel domain-containing protein [Pseudomonas]MBV4455443.1 autotransporter outer membrane beta-barrel domain-containing protein [Pseudomonas azadiae]NMF43784.1 autotransporter outer membrane beta-barrel domain-containing protein [Pseudomonas sp. SWRI 103]
MRMRISHLLFLGITCSAALVTWSSLTHGACAIVPTAGNDTFICDSGISAAFTDTGGDNTLTMSGTGTIAGNATFGAGIDIVTLLDASSTGMQINGSLNQGDGDNILQMNNGTITGSVIQGAGRDIVQFSGGSIGEVLQGAGVDIYTMSAGTVTGDVDQGDGLDDFVMNAGTIVGAFLSGDRATMTGGSIGRVNMLLDDNVFDMKGGTIVANLVTGFGNDTIRVSGPSYIGGNISLSGGTDRVTITGGTVNGQILTSLGEDRLEWVGGGQVNSFILMGGDNDTALLQNLTETIVASTPLIDGGLGVDTLTLDNSQLSTPERYMSWETVNLDNNATLNLGGTFTLGDAGTGTGTMNVNGSSVLVVSTGVLASFDPAQLATLNNRGMIDMVRGSSTASDTFTVNGNYTGTDGQLNLQTVLGDETSLSDKLVISGGAIQGTTDLFVTNLGGAGAATLQDGIQVVQAINGATGPGTAFTLGNAVSAGAFDYYLFKGGATAGTEQSYYLRSTLPVTPLPTPEDPPVQLPIPVDGTPPLPPNPGGKEIPLYRPEVPVYSAQLPAADQMVRATMGTYHERMGDQSAQQTGGTRGGWGRVYGNRSRQQFEGTVSPTLDSSVKGFQVGTDVYAHTDDSGRTQHAGLFVGHSTLKGNVKGFNGGWEDKDAGKTTLRGDSVGGYWTLIGANQAYVDLVVMGTRLYGNNESDRGVKMKTRGRNLTGSAEVGWPFPVSERWVIEPQAQLIVGKTRLDSQNDRISEVEFKADTHVTTRLGARLRGDFLASNMPFRPYLRANVWHASAGDNSVIFNDATRIDTEQKSTTLQVSLGATLQVADGVNLYGEMGYNRNLDSNSYNGQEAGVGLRVNF